MKIMLSPNEGYHIHTGNPQELGRLKTEYRKPWYYSILRYCLLHIKCTKHGCIGTYPSETLKFLFQG